MAHQRACDVGEFVGLYAVAIVIETLYCFIPSPPGVEIKPEFRIFPWLFVDSCHVAFIDLVVLPIKRCLFLNVPFYNIVVLVRGRVVGCYASSRMFCIVVLVHDELNRVFPLLYFQRVLPILYFSFTVRMALSTKAGGVREIFCSTS